MRDFWMNVVIFIGLLIFLNLLLNINKFGKK